MVTGYKEQAKPDFQVSGLGFKVEVVQLSRKEKEEGQGWEKSSEFNCGYVEFKVPRYIQVAFHIICH